MPKGQTYRTNAVGPELRRVDTIAKRVAELALKYRARPIALEGGYELLPEYHQKKSGAYRKREKKIVIYLKNRDDAWRREDEVFRTYLEETAHARTYALGWFDASGNTDKAPEGLREAIADFLARPPYFGTDPDLWRAFMVIRRGYEAEAQEREVVAKIFVQMKIRPDRIKYLYPKLYRRLKWL